MNIPLALDIIRAIHAGQAHTADEIAAAVESSNPTVRRVIGDCNGQLKMDIQWIQTGGAPGGQGSYRIRCWGIFMKSSLVGH